MSKNNTILKGAIILSFAGIITRLLGFLYRVYLAKVIGTEGMGLFQLVIPVYMVCHTTCTTGIFVTCSKLIAAENGKNTIENSRKIIRIATLISVSMAIIISFFAFNLSGFISTSLLHEPRTYNSIRILAISLPFTSLVSMAKSYFYGTKNSVEPAVSQLFEQIVKMAITYSYIYQRSIIGFIRLHNLFH
ncbi:MAG: polysaccharide biosynthesis protein [Bacillales bacterium]|nr:polysaccharide biosynthesis protein [Bacillales bacterium]